MGNVELKMLKITLFMAFFFIFWLGVHYLISLLNGEEEFIWERILYALCMAAGLTYSTNCGESFVKMKREKYEKQ